MVIMARVPLICLSVFLCVLLLQQAECGKDFEQRHPKKDRGHNARQPASEDLNNISGERLDEEAQWRLRIEEKLRRQRELLAEKENRKKLLASRRSSRDLTRTFEIRGPTSTEIPDPPAHSKVAEVARFIVHNSGWASGGYINHHPGKEGMPMATLLSISDGFANASTGVPYMYITPKDIAVQDFAKDNRCSLLMSLAQSDYCKRKEFDPEDPRCAYVILTGKIKQLRNGTDEWNFASGIYFDRHPGMRQVPIGHKFRFAKFKISDLAVQDYFGGLKFPTVKEYFDVKLSNDTEKNLSWN